MAHRLTPRLALLAAALLAWAFSLPSTAEARSALRCDRQVATLRLCAARTDNYKDCYNAPDGERERRTWLPWHYLRARGASYGRVAGQGQFLGSVAVRRASGTRTMPARATLRVVVLSGSVEAVNFRNGPPASQWGILLEIGSTAALQAAPVRLELQLVHNGTIRARTRVAYRYDATLATAPFGNVEHDGPGGRWYVGGRRTWTDWELGSGAAC